MYSTSELDELFLILISIKGFKLKRNYNHTGTTQQYPSSWNRGADERGLEVGDVGRGMWGVKGLCGPGGSIVAVIVLSSEVASGD